MKELEDVYMFHTVYIFSTCDWTHHQPQRTTIIQHARTKNSEHMDLSREGTLGIAGSASGNNVPNTKQAAILSERQPS